VSTASVYPDSTALGEWTPTPAGADHHLRVDDDADDADYISVNGYVAGKQETLGLPVGPTDINYITKIEFMLRIKGVNITTDPGVRAELLIGGIMRAQYEFDATVGVFTSTLVTFDGLFISKTEWELNSRSLRLTPLDAGSDLPQYTQE